VSAFIAAGLMCLLAAAMVLFIGADPLRSEEKSGTRKQAGAT
jgi:hypothetical protein